MTTVTRAAVVKVSEALHRAFRGKYFDEGLTGARFALEQEHERQRQEYARQWAEYVAASGPWSTQQEALAQRSGTLFLVASALSAAFALGFPLALIAGGVSLWAARRKKCGFCGETVLRAATVCKHCRSSLPA